MRDFVACCGGGTIGSGFAVSFALSAYSVNILELNEQAANVTKDTLANIFDFFRDEVGIETELLNKAKKLISVTLDPEEAYKDVCFVQECGPEKYAVKKEMIEIIDKYAPREAVYASSTSGLLVSKLAEFSKFPERVIGAHPYHPSYLIPLIEITMSPHTIIMLAIGAGSGFSFCFMFYSMHSRNANEMTVLTGGAQLVGFVIASAGPVVMGRIFDATNSWRSGQAFLVICVAILFILNLLAAIPSYVFEEK